MTKNKIFVLFALLALVLSLCGSVMANTAAQDVATETNDLSQTVLNSAAAACNVTNCIASAIVSIVIIVANYFIFKKAGYKGWYAIIPVFSTYILFKLAWEKKAFWRGVIYLCGACVIPVVLVLVSGSDSVNNTLAIIACVVSFGLMIAAFVLSIKLYSRLAKSFGKGKGFTVGLVLLNTIFLCILGFNKSIKYIGENPGPDFAVEQAEA